MSPYMGTFWFSCGLTVSVPELLWPIIPRRSTKFLEKVAGESLCRSIGVSLMVFSSSLISIFFYINILIFASYQYLQIRTLKMYLAYTLTVPNFSSPIAFICMVRQNFSLAKYFPCTVYD